MRIKFGAERLLMNEAGADGGDAGGAGVASTSDTPSADTPSGELDFGGLMDTDGDDLGGDEGGAPSAEPVAPTDAQPAPAPAATPAPAAVAPVAEPAAAPAPAVTPSAAEPTPSVDPVKQREEARQVAYQGLVGSWQQQLTPEVVEQVMTDPATMLPQLMAQVELRAMETSIQQIMRQIPGMIQQHEARQAESKMLADTFFNEFPALKGMDDAVVAAYARFQQLPGFDFRDPAHRQQMAGALMMQLKINPQVAQPAAPATAARPTPSPAGSSAAPAVAPKPAQTNVWAAMVDDDIYPE